MCACGTDRHPRGAALVIAMLVMAVLLLAGTTFMTISSTESQIALNEQVSTKALLLAEAAINKAIARLNASSGYTGETNTPLGGGTFTVTVTTVAGCTASSARSLVVTASVPVRGGQAQAQIRATVDRISYPFRWAMFSTLREGVAPSSRRNKELWIDRNATVDSFDSSLGTYDATNNRGRVGDIALDRLTGGDIGANADMTVERDTRLGGNVTARDRVFLGSGITVDGTQTEEAPSEPFPSLSATATGGLTVSAGNTQDLPAGTYYYNALNLGNNARLTTSQGTDPDPRYIVTVYVTGPVNIQNNVILGNVPTSLDPWPHLRIITKSDGADTASVNFNAGDGFIFYGSLYGKNTDIQVGNTAQIFGSMIGRMIQTGRQASVHFDQTMYDQGVCHNGKFNVRRGTWREVTS